MPRRGSNIYKRKDGRFEGRVPIGHKEDGSLKYKFVYARTLSEVKGKMAQFQAVLQNQPVSALKLTVAEASRQWLFSCKCCCLFSAFEIPPDKFSDCSKQENACFFSDSDDLFMNFQKYILYFF